MKAFVYKEYGLPIDVLKLEEIEQPIPKENEVMVKIHATSINSWDWDMVTGIPRIYQLISGVGKPKYPTIGIDIAGKVEAIGSKVKDLKIGDEVFGDISSSGFGAYAEYTCADEKFLALKPGNASFEEAAAIPHGGVMALLGTHFNGEVQAGQQVLINGAGGSTGPFAIQIAKSKGATVTCVDTEQKFEMLKELGADYCIDYKKEDFTKKTKKYDLIIDLMAHHSVFDYIKILKPHGALCVVGGSVGKILQIALFGSFLSLFTKKKMGLMALRPGKQNLEKLRHLYEKRKIKSVIDKVYPFEEIPAALQLLGEGKIVGKIVIKL